MKRFSVISRKVQIGLVGMGLFILAIASSATASAATPVYVTGYTPNACVLGNAVCGYTVGAVPGYPAYGYAPAYVAAPVYGYAYKDNRFCGDGNVIATPGGYRCANGAPLYIGGQSVPASNSVNPVSPGNPYRVGGAPVVLGSYEIR